MMVMVFHGDVYSVLGVQQKDDQAFEAFVS
jgi:hypothetical protein